MPLDIWFAFAVATTVLLVVPGPTILLVVSYALTGGRRTAFYTVPGVALGDFTAMVGSLAGLGALLAASATAFTVVKWIGAAYLIWLGIKMWRVKPQLFLQPSLDVPAKRLTMGINAYAVTALNPKGIVFFVAFLPQFLSADLPVTPQFTVMGATFLTLAIVNALLYAVLAGTLRRWLKRPRLIQWVHRGAGSLLIGAGLTMATLKRS